MNLQVVTHTRYIYWQDVTHKIPTHKTEIA